MASPSTGDADLTNTARFKRAASDSEMEVTEEGASLIRNEENFRGDKRVKQDAVDSDRAIADHSANAKCLELCPALYEATNEHFWRLEDQHVTCGYVDLRTLSKDDLIVRAKASVTDHDALYRALQVHHKLGEYATSIKEEYKQEAAGGVLVFEMFNVGAVMFQPDCRVDARKTTWGADDVAKIFGVTSIPEPERGGGKGMAWTPRPKVVFLDDGQGVPPGLGWHFFNIVQGDCRFCAAADSVHSSNANDESETVTNGSGDACLSAMGLDAKTCAYSSEDSAVDALINNSEQHRAFCSNVVRPLTAYMDATLTDVKFVTILSHHRCEPDGMSFLGGLTADGYLVGMCIGFVNVE
ncbi:Aste57867_10225 [Aphanomyces stellatus]|uniref:Aste57867_10225 protein n=1 Tax=Aphanomyces stellatus TaxID=120398 RepID=A0A485KPT4_9STRA|nr:hypothetical protein As57867_010186 [Aphanomyces stellatus]VFT87100.1 Aste57867_10225 [Aphanomyces stellatus]